MPNGRPSGTLTFLFTDIEGSTQLWEHRPDAMRVALARHDQLLRAAIGSHGGVIFSTGGDGVAAAFDRSTEAVSAALAAQRDLRAEPWPEGVELRVRMGMHTGEVEERDDDYFGPPVNCAARVAAAARGGQILASEATMSVLGRPIGISLGDLGVHRLRGLLEPLRLFSVASEEVPWLDRPLATELAARGNLPHPATEFVGRIDRLRERVGPLSGRSIVTLVGPGGAGKTRAAIELAGLVGDDFPDGRWLVELASVSDSAGVASAVAATLPIHVSPGVTVLAAVADWLRARRLLVVLDNCEHVLDGVAEVVGRVLADCADVSVLATSREPLGVNGERVVVADALTAPESAELFVSRATSADVGFEPSDLDRDTIARICQRLDGNPLAIELAAARIRSLSLVDLETRLDDRFRLLRGSTRRAVPRHQTLRAVVDWSYQLLTEPEQTLFARVSAFTGGFDLAGAAMVGDDLGTGDDVVDITSSLVDKSMLVATRSDGTVRFRMLETIREFGQEILVERGELEEVAIRHLRHVVDVTELAQQLRISPRQAEGEAIFDREWDNVRGAMRTALTSRAPDETDRLVMANLSFAWNHARADFFDWADAVYQASDGGSSASGPICLGLACSVFTAPAIDVTLLDVAARAAIERSSDDRTTARGWQLLALSRTWMGDQREAEAAIEHAEAHAAHLDPESASVVLFGRTVVNRTFARASYPAAVRAFASFADDVGAPWLIGEAHEMQGNVALDRNDLSDARTHFEIARQIAIDHGSIIDETTASLGLAMVLLQSQRGVDLSEAQTIVARLHDLRAWDQLWVILDIEAARRARRGELRLAATIVGRLAAINQSEKWSSTFRNQATSILGDEPQSAQWMAEGAAKSNDEVVDLVLAHLDARASSAD